MSYIAGFDYDSNGVYVALIDEDDASFAGARVFDLKAGPGNAFDRVRRLAGLMPGPTAWEDGIVAIGIEETFSMGYHVTKALGRVQGAILALLPRDVPIYELAANRSEDGWKAMNGLRTNARKPAVRERALELGVPAQWPQDVYDAFLIARAARRLHERTNR